MKEYQDMGKTNGHHFVKGLMIGVVAPVVAICVFINYPTINREVW